MVTIIENKKATLDKANDISNKILDLIVQEYHIFDPVDDPAEPMYMDSQIMGILLAKTCIVMKNFSKIYGMVDKPIDFYMDWIVTIARENIQFNREMVDEME